MRALWILLAIASTAAGVWQCMAEPGVGSRSQRALPSACDPAGATNAVPDSEKAAVQAAEPEANRRDGSDPDEEELEWWGEHCLTVLTGDPAVPVPDANVWLIQGSHDRRYSIHRVTDSQGRVFLKNPTERHRQLLIRKTGFVLRHFSVRFGCLPDSVHLTPGTPISGTIRIAPHGVPAVGATVFVWDSETNRKIASTVDGIDFYNDASIVSDDQGRFSIDGIADGGKAIICVVVPGYGVYREVHPTTSDLRIELGRGATVEGRIFGPDGRPLADADVYVEPEDNHRDPWFGIISSSRVNARTKTDGDGLYRVIGMEPGNYFVTASHAYWARGESEPVTLHGGRHHVWREVTVERCAHLRVRLEDADGRPLLGPFSRCRLQRPDGSLARSRYWSNSSVYSDGIWRRDGLPAGTYVVHARDARGRVASADFTLAPGETRELGLRVE